TFATWQSGRDDAAFVFAVAASMFIACLSIGTVKGRRQVIWFLAGGSTGIAGSAYYPFAAAAMLISVLGLWALVWYDTNLRLQEKVTASACFAAGVAVASIAVTAWMSTHFAYCRQQILGMAPDYLSFKATFGSQIQRALVEWRRYWE